MKASALQDSSLTPREIVGELDRYIIGQEKAKRAVAVALRNRWRRQQVPEELRDEIAPKNIIMMGPTGVGKTEIARRLAKLARAPFVKVEATKFTEVGYVGRDVESMVRDLVEISIKLVREERVEAVQDLAAQRAERRLAELIAKSHARAATGASPQSPPPAVQPRNFGPFVISAAAPEAAPEPQVAEDTIVAVLEQLKQGKLEDEKVELDVADEAFPFMTVFGQGGAEDVNLKDMLRGLPGMNGRKKKRTLSAREARRLLRDQEAQKLIDADSVNEAAIERVEQSGIIFLDEIDKVAAHQSRGGADVSREGVQRDLLPIVEGSTVSTKYGQVRTDHVLFIAAGAFHVSSVSDLIPELQGRFPIRVELESLKKEDFVRILSEPKNSLTRQYSALMETEGISLKFETSGVEALAEVATEANERAENIGARRLHTIMEALLEGLSFDAPDQDETTVTVNEGFVRSTLDPIVGDENLAKYIL